MLGMSYVNFERSKLAEGISRLYARNWKEWKPHFLSFIKYLNDCQGSQCNTIMLPKLLTKISRPCWIMQTFSQSKQYSKRYLFSIFNNHLDDLLYTETSLAISCRAFQPKRAISHQLAFFCAVTEPRTSLSSRALMCRHYWKASVRDKIPLEINALASKKDNSTWARQTTCKDTTFVSSRVRIISSTKTILNAVLQISGKL